jgi:hypothetical protein
MKPLKILFVLGIMFGFVVSANSQGDGKQVERPFKGSFNAVVVEEYPSYEILSITGNTTHVGNFTGEFGFDRVFTINWGTGELSGETIYNGTIIAANGDKIFFESADPGMKLDLPFNPANRTGIMAGWATITGGTGRFKNCSGDLFQVGTFNMTHNYAMWTAEGWIKY